MKFLRKINLEINKDLYNPIQVKQGDNSRYLLFNLLDNGVPFSLENKTVRVYGLKPDGTKVFNNLTIINAARGLAELQLTTQMLVKPGCLKLELVIYEATDILSTTKFDIDIISCIRDDGAIESTNEFSALTLGLSKLDEWDKYFKETSAAIEEKYTERLNGIDASLEENVQLINSKTSELDSKTNALENTKVNKIDLEKETLNRKEEIELERARIDALTKLEEGSTTGDAELIDGRISSEGKQYNNIGSAIREQNKNVNNKIDNEINNNIYFSNKYDFFISEFKRCTLNKGVEQPSNIRLTTNFIKVDGGVFNIDIKNGYKYSITTFNNAQGYKNEYGWTDKCQDYKYDGCGYVRLVIYDPLNRNDVIDIEDVRQSINISNGIINTKIVDIYNTKSIKLDVKFEQGNIVNNTDTASPNYIRSGIIKLPWKNAKIKITVKDSIKYNIIEYNTDYDLKKEHGLSDNYSANIISTNNIKVVLCDTTWSGTLTPQNIGDKFNAELLLDNNKLQSYYDSEITEIIDKGMNVYSNNGLNFLFITDSHYEYISPNHEVTSDIIESQLKSIVEITKKYPVDCVIHGGDLLHGSNKGKTVPFEVYKKVVNCLSEVKCPVFFVRGNHDDNMYYSERPDSSKPYNDYVPVSNLITDDEWLGRLQKPLCRRGMVHDSQKNNSTYYYYDFEDKKVRLIILNAYDYPIIDKGDGYAQWVSESWNKFSDRQQQWLVEEALTIKENWKYIIAVHGILVDGTGDAKITNADKIVNIFEALNSRTSYIDETLSINKNFSDYKSKIKCVIYGHTHADIYSRKNGIDYICTGSSKISTHNAPDHTIEYYYIPVRKKLDITESLFDLYSVQDNSINRIRFGAGIDQVINN